MAFRSLRNDPGFLAVSILTLALGVGANTAAFSVLKSVVINQLPYKDPDRLVTIAEADGHTSDPQSVASGTVLDWRRRNHSFESLSLYQDAGFRALDNGRGVLIRGMAVNYDFFDTLGVRMYLGRTFLLEEDRPAASNKLILSYGPWKSRYGGDPSVIGRVTPIFRRSYMVVGVLPPDFHPLHMTTPGEVPIYFTLLGYDQDELLCRTCRGQRLIGRLKANITPGQARADLNSIMRHLAREYPADYSQDASVVVTPFRDHLVGSFQTGLWVVFASVGFLLLLACANIANLLLGRATERSRETAVRFALGAGRMRIARQIANNRYFTCSRWMPTSPNHWRSVPSFFRSLLSLDLWPCSSPLSESTELSLIPLPCALAK